MADKKDDPREVLSLLNSLGFVGITAQQLKAFMKDLKMHRKIKERERQLWKEDTKKKILLQQQQLYREVLREHKIERGFTSVTESTISSESSAFHDDSSSCKLVTVKIRCFPKDRQDEAEKENNNNNKDGDDVPRRTKKTSFTKTHTSWAEEFRQNSLQYGSSYNTTSSTASVDESHRRLDRSNNLGQNHSAGASTDSTKYISLEKTRGRVAHFDQHLKQSNLAPPKLSAKRKSSATRCQVENKTENVKPQQTANEVPTNPPPSRSSAASSRPKSFIRPWRLQPESHRSCTNTKSDPVALYQKYREEWKQLALPGEENHAGVRWAVREKMLGIDPNPRPSENPSIREMITDRDSQGLILESREGNVRRHKSRKIGKIIFSGDSVRSRTKTIFLDRREQRECFKSISESFLVQSKSFKLSRNSQEADNFRSILTLSSTFAKYKRRRVKIEEVCEIRSMASKDVCKLKETRSEVSGAKRTLDRIIGNILGRDLNAYVENYKYMDKCCCVLNTEFL